MNPTTVQMTTEKRFASEPPVIPGMQGIRSQEVNVARKKDGSSYLNLHSVGVSWV